MGPPLLTSQQQCSCDELDLSKAEADLELKDNKTALQRTQVVLTSASVLHLRPFAKTSQRDLGAGD